MLIPSIDLLDGKAVQLQQGNPDKIIVEKENLLELLNEFSLYGEVAIIDLNAALGRGDNKQLIKTLLSYRSCRVGGGIRDYETARDYLASGASKIIIGTNCQDDFVTKLPKKQLVFAIDAFDDNWAIKGWKEKSEVKVLDLIPQLENKCSEFLYTQVNKEGLLKGIDQKRVDDIVKTSKVPVTIAGGITDYSDIQYINNLGANSQIGMSLYTNKINLKDGLMSCLDFDKSELIPTIVQDYDTGNVLMLAYSNKSSLSQAVDSKRGVYYSRSRNEIWQKGLTSGNDQKLMNIDYDCDGDTLIFQVQQTGNACHFNRYSCFPSQSSRFNLNSLDKVLQRRMEQPQITSYTNKLFKDKVLQAEKLQEECLELIEAESEDDVRWEAADLLYFALVNAKSKGVSAASILNELGARNAE